MIQSGPAAPGSEISNEMCIRDRYITESMESFGLRLEDGTIIATDEAYVPLLMSGYYYSIRPIFSNQC